MKVNVVEVDDLQNEAELQGLEVEVFEVVLRYIQHDEVIDEEMQILTVIGEGKGEKEEEKMLNLQTIGMGKRMKIELDSRY